MLYSFFIRYDRKRVLRIHNCERSVCGFWLGYSHGEGPGKPAYSTEKTEGEPLALGKKVSDILVTAGVKDAQILEAAVAEITTLFKKSTKP